MIKEDIAKLYGNRVRLRVCGVLRTNGGILCVGSRLHDDDHLFWSPPGGEPEFGESLQQALEREFTEEVKLNISVGDFLEVHEHIAPPLHAVELFFEAHQTDKRSFALGHDPEEAGGAPSLVVVKVIRQEDLTDNAQNQFHPVLFHLLNKK